jgi:glycine hydroxymethyltransferase
MQNPMLDSFLLGGLQRISEDDPLLFDMFCREYQRQMETLTLVASCSMIDPSVLVCEAMPAANVTAEGYPGRRFHAGCNVIDEIESLAIQRACHAFGARYANVQAHSASSANLAVICSLLKPGQRIMGMRLDAGGHLSHGSPMSLAGRYFEVASYGLNLEGLVDYDEVAALAREFRPHLLICGATAYSRTLDFARFRAIADEVGAYLLADITHVAGLVAAGVYPNPVNHAHVTTTCTHKQLFGPRGGLILLGKDASSQVGEEKKKLAEVIQSAIFPLTQGAPVPNNIAAKARALGRIQQPQFRRIARNIVDDARALAGSFQERGYHVVSGGTDTHIVLLNLSSKGLSGIVAQNALEEAGIVVNKNKVPGDRRNATVAGGIRLGTNTVSMRGLGPEEMAHCVKLIDRVLQSTTMISDTCHSLDAVTRSEVTKAVRDLCASFPPPGYLSIPTRVAAGT